MAKVKILVVDDDPLTLRLLDDMLTKEGYSVIKAQTGKEGKELALKHRPDLVFMDILLPDVDGAETVNSLVDESPLRDLPVIVFVSGIITETEDQVPTIKVGGRKYKAVSKPFERETILAVLRSELKNLKK